MYVKSNCNWRSVPHFPLNCWGFSSSCDDDDDPFLTADDNEDELEANKLAVYSTFKWHVIHVCVGKAFQIALLNVIVPALV